MKQRVIHVGLIGAFLFAIALSASPQLHERFHPDAGKSQHECAVTLIASGTCHHSAVPPIVIIAAPQVALGLVAPLCQVWVASSFLDARIFEHAPPV